MRARRLLVAALAAVALAAGSCSDESGHPVSTAPPLTAPPDGTVVELVPRVVRTLPHDTDVFTQGLEVDGDTLVESAGLYGQSAIRRLDAATGEELASTPLDEEHFGEGLTRVDDRWIQLTWLQHIALVWDEELREVERIPFADQGWGLCFDGEVLQHTDGSPVLRQRDPATLREVGRVTVTLDGVPQSQLNELECVEGTVWANVWHTTDLLGIDPTTGEVTQVVDASSLAEQVEVGDPSEDVLNGIAYNDATGTWWLTGKRWPTLFEVELVPAD